MRSLRGVPLAYSRFDDVPDGRPLLVHSCEDCACPVSHVEAAGPHGASVLPTGAFTRARAVLGIPLDDDHRALFQQLDARSILAVLHDIQVQLDYIISGEPGTVGYAASTMKSSGGSVRQAFVIMPFAEQHIDTFDAIRRGVKRADTTIQILRVDELPGAIPITDEIKRLIRTSDLIVCDLTEERPNVYYELGFANGLSKRVICIARKDSTIHFDVSGMKVLYFDTYRSLEDRLERDVRGLLAG